MNLPISTAELIYYYEILLIISSTHTHTYTHTHMHTTYRRSHRRHTTPHHLSLHITIASQTASDWYRQQWTNARDRAIQNRAIRFVRLIMISMMSNLCEISSRGSAVQQYRTGIHLSSKRQANICTSFQLDNWWRVLTYVRSTCMRKQWPWVFIIEHISQRSWISLYIYTILYIYI